MSKKKKTYTDWINLTVTKLFKPFTKIFIDKQKKKTKNNVVFMLFRQISFTVYLMTSIKIIFLSLNVISK